ncbi:MAG TPA: prolipoprotein diacylglyceryl transferase [Epsilonproteobacteria bacterium]|nr:prolipoprotein diacylglyceryl transferase [Campylobacterota bacterium]
MHHWNHIYDHFDPVAFHFGFLLIHWYAIMYAFAILSALWFAKYMIKKDHIPIKNDITDSFFIWIEIGIILGARIGYILFYDPHTAYYLAHPWQMFNPFADGEFVGIRGMSYHGAILGALMATFLFGRKHPAEIYQLFDIVGLAVPVGYIFGRIGNFLNQELVGRETDAPWGIYVEGVLRHPSQLYEALLEGALVALLIFTYRRHKHFDGELLPLYGMLYGAARFIAEFWREPDFQLGFICCGWMSMGQMMSLMMILLSIGLYLFVQKYSTQKQRSTKNKTKYW